jgi:hypothetical protein
MLRYNKTTNSKLHIYLNDITSYHNACVGRDSSVGIATDYGLDGPGIESR